MRTHLPALKKIEGPESRGWRYRGAKDIAKGEGTRLDFSATWGVGKAHKTKREENSSVRKNRVDTNPVIRAYSKYYDIQVTTHGGAKAPTRLHSRKAASPEISSRR